MRIGVCYGILGRVKYCILLTAIWNDKGECPIEGDDFSVRYCDSLESLTLSEGKLSRYQMRIADMQNQLLYREYGCPVGEIAGRNGICNVNLILIRQKKWFLIAGEAEDEVHSKRKTLEGMLIGEKTIYKKH